MSFEVETVDDPHCCMLCSAHSGFWLASRMRQLGMIVESRAPRIVNVGGETRNRLLRASGTHVRGVPQHKFRSNEGWIVTSHECDYALDILDARDPPEPADADKRVLWLGFVGFLRSAATLGGFRVR